MNFCSMNAPLYMKSMTTVSIITEYWFDDDEEFAHTESSDIVIIKRNKSKIKLQVSFHNKVNLSILNVNLPNF